MKIYKGYEQRGLLYLLSLIVLIQFAYWIYLNNMVTSPDTSFNNTPELARRQKIIDSLKRLEIERRKPKMYPFNPSFITDYKGYKLGMKTAEIDRLFAYRKSGKYIHSVAEFQRVTGVSDSLLKCISPYFKFPDWVVQKNKQRQKKNQSKQVSSKKSSPVMYTGKKDINKATKEDFLHIHGVTPKLALRIVKYRKKLHGFLIDKQLYEVWYLKKEVARRILQRYTVLTKPNIQKININTAHFKEVLHAPYMDYELTKKIFAYRDEVAEIQSMEELKKIEGFPVDKFDRISLYLTVE